ncbi:hypothetical protein [Novosphingobium sp. fls2-241-R2A-195]|uniref:hypothetical protein n=1 Tax=Novosphingobium sp. fls2-241-R2A-195 TaxID=3040296 RepID=UPI0025515C91|nr:hypothetical protein [Novosphingobium sp. fls2-241-R2A-195]
MNDIERLRMASEDDVERAFAGAYVSLPLTDQAMALEFFNRMIDVMLGEKAGDAIMWPNLRRETPN